MNKFENVDIFASLDAIMRQNTGFFQSDFDIDKEIIAKAAASPNREDTLYGTADDNYVYRCDYRQYTWIYDI